MILSVIRLDESPTRLNPHLLKNNNVAIAISYSKMNKPLSNVLASPRYFDKKVRCHEFTSNISSVHARCGPLADFIAAHIHVLTGSNRNKHDMKIIYEILINKFLASLLKSHFHSTNMFMAGGRLDKDNIQGIARACVCVWVGICKYVCFH